MKSSYIAIALKIGSLVIGCFLALVGLSKMLKDGFSDLMLVSLLFGIIGIIAGIKIKPPKKRDNDDKYLKKS